jgi:predicted deacylase
MHEALRSISASLRFTFVLIVALAIAGLSPPSFTTARAARVRAASQAGEFAVGPVRAARGTAASGALEVPARVDEGTTIPVTVIHGARQPGPVLALVAGTHGMEYVPIVALQRLRGAIDPATLRGTVVLVHVANLPSFLRRTIYYSPVDGKNLNRVFPGSPEGTLSERIADVITREVIARADVVIDLHCGDGNEWLRPYTYWIATGDPEVARRSRELALAFGLERIVVDRERPTDPRASVYLSNTAVLRGKPALTTETGGLARVDEASIALVERGVAGVLRHLGMREDGPPPVVAPVWIERHVVLRAGATGLLTALVEAGARVEADAPVARIADFHGRPLEEIRAPFAGEVLYVVATPPISTGEPVAMIGSTSR